MTLGRDVATGVTVAGRHVAGASRVTGSAVRRAAVGTGEVAADGSMAVARGARTGVAWTVVQWRIERHGRRVNENAVPVDYNVDDGVVNYEQSAEDVQTPVSATSPVKATKHPSKEAGKQHLRPSATS